MCTLLDDLLAEGAKALSERDPSSPSLATRGPSTSDATAPSPGSLSCCQVSPRTRQIAELCGEMDACLSSLGRWEEDRRGRLMPMAEDLQVKDFDDLDTPRPQEVAGAAAGQVMDDVVVRHSASIVSAASCGLSSPSRLSKLQVVENSMRAADEDRIASLRAELENLRRRDAEMEQEVARDWHTDEQNVPLGYASLSDFSALCREAHEALAESSTCDGRGDPAAIHSDEDIDSVEAKLLQAQSGLAEVEGALQSARSHIDWEIAELERLMADCGDASPGGLCSSP